MKHMYERACVVFVHSGTVLSITGGVGHGVEAMSSLTEKGRPARGRVGETSVRGVTAFLENKVWRGQTPGL